MQGLPCWSGYFFDQNPTGKRSIFTRPLRVKNALAFLHRVFTNLFEPQSLNFRAFSRHSRLAFAERSHTGSMSMRLFCVKLRAVNPL